MPHTVRNGTLDHPAWTPEVGFKACGFEFRANLVFKGLGFRGLGYGDYGKVSTLSGLSVYIGEYIGLRKGLS